MYPVRKLTGQKGFFNGMETGGQYLHQKDSKLHTSKPVEVEGLRRKRAGEKLSQKPADKINSWLSLLERTHTGKGASEARQAAQPKVLERIKELYHRPTSEGGYITGTDDKSINGYLAHQAEIAHQQGHGEVEDIMGRVDEQVRAEARSSIIQDQERSLDRWVDYLTSEDAGYPAWFKYYVFKNITKLATYDKDKDNGIDKATGQPKPKGGFPSRSADTTAPFPDINREALAYMEDSLAKHYGLKETDPNNQADQIDPKTLHVLNNDSSFASLYKRAIEYAAPKHAENLNVSDGQWVKFEQTTDQAKSDELAHSLHGYGTGWCTAGEGMAHTQLSGGDFYVYYTKSEDGQYSVPRVAIRMQNEGGQQSIAEVRGVEAEQNLEGELAGITEQKMREVDPQGAESYTKKAADMRHLTDIEKLLKDNPHAELSDEDLIFLYELKSPIEGFGYGRDPRIGGIKQKRIDFIETQWDESGYALSGYENSIDNERLKPLIIETIRQQAETSFKASQEVMQNLGLEPITQEQFSQAFEAKWVEWEQNGTFEWVASRFEHYGERYTLVATPNTLATSGQLMDLGDAFAKGQGYDEAYKYPELYNLYSPEELSGSLEPGQAIRFSLIPDQYTAELGSNSVDNQLIALAEMQTTQANIRIPSVLDAVAYRYARRANGDSLNSGSVGDRTWIRHINLKPQELGGSSFVPVSGVDNGGKPRLYGYDASRRSYGRVSVR